MYDETIVERDVALELGNIKMSPANEARHKALHLATNWDYFGKITYKVEKVSV